MQAIKNSVIWQPIPERRNFKINSSIYTAQNLALSTPPCLTPDTTEKVSLTALRHLHILDKFEYQYLRIRIQQKLTQRWMSLRNNPS